MKHGQFILSFRTPLSILESMTLSLFWCGVLGKDSTVISYMRNTGDRVVYETDNESMLRMELALTDESYETSAAFHEQMPLTDAAALMSTFGVTDDFVALMSAVRKKITKIRRIEDESV